MTDPKITMNNQTGLTVFQNINSSECDQRFSFSIMNDAFNNGSISGDFNASLYIGNNHTHYPSTNEIGHSFESTHVPDSACNTNSIQGKPNKELADFVETFCSHISMDIAQSDSKNCSPRSNDESLDFNKNSQCLSNELDQISELERSWKYCEHEMTSSGGSVDTIADDVNFDSEDLLQTLYPNISAVIEAQSQRKFSNEALSENVPSNNDHEMTFGHAYCLSVSSNSEDSNHAPTSCIHQYKSSAVNDSMVDQNLLAAVQCVAKENCAENQKLTSETSDQLLLNNVKKTCNVGELKGTVDFESGLDSSNESFKSCDFETVFNNMSDSGISSVSESVWPDLLDLREAFDTDISNDLNFKPEMEYTLIKNSQIFNIRSGFLDSSFKMPDNCPETNINSKRVEIDVNVATPKTDLDTCKSFDLDLYSQFFGDYHSGFNSDLSVGRTDLKRTYAELVCSIRKHTGSGKQARRAFTRNRQYPSFSRSSTFHTFAKSLPAVFKRRRISCDQDAKS